MGRVRIFNLFVLIFCFHFMFLFLFSLFWVCYWTFSAFSSFLFCSSILMLIRFLFLHFVSNPNFFFAIFIGLTHVIWLPPGGVLIEMHVMVTLSFYIFVDSLFLFVVWSLPFLIFFVHYIFSLFFCFLYFLCRERKWEQDVIKA